MRKLTGMFAAVLLAASLTLCSCAKTYTASSESFVFDTYSRINIAGTNAEETLSALNASFEEMSGAFEKCYGTPAADLPENGIYADCAAKISALNKLYGDKVNICCGALTALWGISTDSPRVPADEEIAEALTKITPDSEGMMYDFGAAAKGYACDKAYEYLKTTETEYAVVSMSSTALMYGKKPRGEKFRTGVIDPLTGNGYMGVIETEAAFISTSGGYERFFEADGQKYSHILDISTGRPAETDLISVTVTVPADTPNGGIMSDFLATLIYIEGTAGLDKYLADESFQMVAVDKDGGVYSNCEGFVLDAGNGAYHEK